MKHKHTGAFGLVPFHSNMYFAFVLVPVVNVLTFEHAHAHRSHTKKNSLKLHSRVNAVYTTSETRELESSGHIYMFCCVVHIRRLPERHAYNTRVCQSNHFSFISFEFRQNI